MDRLIIEGGVPLQGELQIEGAKNAALPALTAALLAETGDLVLDNIPGVVDIRSMCKLLEHMGMTSDLSGNTVTLPSCELGVLEAPYDLVRKMRASILVLGPMLARYGQAKVSFPGGCAIGARPVNLHIKGLEAMGAKITLHKGYIEAHADRLKGAHIPLKRTTVTGTENLMMAATLADGCTRIENAAREPEISDLAALLCSMGAKIRGAGTPTIEIEGVTRLTGTRHHVIPDRIETATFAAAAAITGGDLVLRGARPEHLSAVLQKMTEAGVLFATEPGALRVSSQGELSCVDITTEPYPGFPTDVQAQFMSLMCLANGKSRIREAVFENRFMHVAELRRLGANIRCRGSVARIRGVPHLEGAPLMATDLRASACLVLAALAARGTSQINRIYHLDRGYHRIGRRLSSVGARVHREPD